MDILIKSAKVVDPASKHNGKTVDILIRKGKIEKIGKDLKAETGVRAKRCSPERTAQWIKFLEENSTPGYPEDVDMEI